MRYRGKDGRFKSNDYVLLLGKAIEHRLRDYAEAILFGTYRQAAKLLDDIQVLEGEYNYLIDHAEDSKHE